MGTVNEAAATDGHICPFPLQTADGQGYARAFLREVLKQTPAESGRAQAR